MPDRQTATDDDHILKEDGEKIRELCNKLDMLKKRKSERLLFSKEEEEWKSLSKNINAKKEGFVKKHGRVVFSALNAPSNSVTLVATKGEVEVADGVEEKVVIGDEQKKTDKIPVKFSLDANGVRISTLSDCAALPHAVAALINSGHPGKVFLPGDCNYDQAVTLLTDFLKPIYLVSNNNTMPDGCYLRWYPGTAGTPPTLEVFLRSAETPAFFGITARRRVGATGVPVTAKGLHTAIIDIKLDDVLQSRNIVIEVAEIHLDHFAKNIIEGNTVEHKEITWWDMRGAAVGPVKARKFADVVAEHLKKYMVEMYVLDCNRTMILAELNIGTRDKDLRIVGVPLLTDCLKDAIDKMRLELAKAVARLFPSPPLKVMLEWAELKTLESIKDALRVDGTDHVVVITNDNAIREVGRHVSANGGWVLAVQLKSNKKKGAIVSAQGVRLCVSGLFSDVKGGGKLLASSKEFSTHFDCDFEVWPHIAVSAVLEPLAKRPPAGKGLFRNGSFGYAVIFEGRGSVLHAMRLSPFATWAHLHSRSRQSLVSHFKHSQTELICHCTTGALDIAHETLDGLVFTRNANLPPLPANKQRRIVFCVETEPRELRHLFADDQDPNTHAIVLLDTDPVRLQQSLKYVLDHHVARVVDICLYLSRLELLNSMTPAAPNASSFYPSPRSEEGQKTIEEFLAGKGNAQMPDDDSYVDQGTAAREQEVILTHELRLALNAETAPSVVTVHALLPGMGTTTLLQRVARKLRGEQNTFAAVISRSKVAIDVLAKAALSDSIALLIASPVQQSEIDRGVLVKALADRRKMAQVGVAVLQVLVHELGDEIPPGEIYLDPLLSKTEAKSFIDLYRRFFPHSVADLVPLVMKDMWVGLPGLVVSEGRHHGSGRTLETLKQRLVWGHREDGTRVRFLAQLAALELFATGGVGLGPAKLCGGCFHRDWIMVLENPARTEHRLVSIVWAVPLLRTMAKLDVKVDPTQPSGFALTQLSGAPQTLSSLMLDALIALAQSKVSLEPYLRKSRDSNGASCNPRWLQLVEASEGNKSLQCLLKELLERWPQMEKEERNDEMMGSYTQASVLLAQQLERHKKWTDGLSVLNRAVDVCLYSSSDRIAKTKRCRLVTSGVVDGHQFNDIALENCVTDFEDILTKGDCQDFKPTILWEHAVYSLSHKAFHDKMAGRSQPAWLYKKLSQLRDFDPDFDSAPPAPELDGFSYSSKVCRRGASVGRPRAPRPLRSPSPSPIRGNDQVDATTRINSVLSSAVCLA